MSLEEDIWAPRDTASAPKTDALDRPYWTAAAGSVFSAPPNVMKPQPEQMDGRPLWTPQTGSVFPKLQPEQMLMPQPQPTAGKGRSAQTQYNYDIVQSHMMMHHLMTHGGGLPPHLAGLPYGLPPGVVAPSPWGMAPTYPDLMMGMHHHHHLHHLHHHHHHLQHHQMHHPPQHAAAPAHHQPHPQATSNQHQASTSNAQAKANAKQPNTTLMAQQTLTNQVAPTTHLGGGSGYNRVPTQPKPLGCTLMEVDVGEAQKETRLYVSEPPVFTVDRADPALTTVRYALPRPKPANLPMRPKG